MIGLLGGATSEIDLSARPAVLMLVGLQGSGKTTTCAKLALHLRRLKKKTYLVPADVYRPAAIEQLQKLASQLGVPCHPSQTGQNPVDICAAALEEAKRTGADAVIFDTAGRLHIDDELMNELAAIKAKTSPQEILFVADAMTGQDAVTVAAAFNERLSISGVVLTKMDGDARGGAALSIKAVTGKPIKFIGVGEKLSEIEVFHPDRAASRILGMGDILTLIEKAQSEIGAEEAAAMEKKLRKAQFTLEDFRTQMRRVRKLGSIEGLLKLIPAQEAGRRPGSRKRDEPRRGDHQFHDPGRARRPQDHRTKPQEPHLQRLRDHGPGGQPAPAQFRADAHDDAEDDGRGRGAARDAAPAWRGGLRPSGQTGQARAVQVQVGTAAREKEETQQGKETLASLGGAVSPGRRARQTGLAQKSKTFSKKSEDTHMALRIRLTRMGSKKRPFYRVVAMDSQTRRDGRPLDFVGHYNPMTDPAEIKIDKDKVKKWLDLGAKPSDTVLALLKKAGI